MPGPIAFFNQPANTYYSIKVNMAGIDKLIPEIEKTWTSHYPDNPFNYFFLDDFYNQQYFSDQRFNKLFLVKFHTCNNHCLSGSVGPIRLCYCQTIQRNRNTQGKRSEDHTGDGIIE